MNQFEKPTTLRSTIEKRDTNKLKKKVPLEEQLTKQEKSLLRQAKTLENTSIVFNSPENLPVELETEPVDFDDISFEDIVTKKTPEETLETSSTRELPKEETEIEKILGMFGTIVPSELDMILAEEEESGAITLESNHWDDYEDNARNKSQQDPHENLQRKNHELYKREQKPWFSRVKNWFKKDQAAGKEFAYDQNRNEIDRGLENTTENEDLEKASREYQKTLTHEQENYDYKIWAENLKNKNIQTNKLDNSSHLGNSPENQSENENPHSARFEYFKKFIYQDNHEKEGFPESDTDQNYDQYLQQMHDDDGGPYSRTEDLEIDLDNELHRSLKEKKRAPRGNIKGF